MSEERDDLKDPLPDPASLSAKILSSRQSQGETLPTYLAEFYELPRPEWLVHLASALVPVMDPIRIYPEGEHALEDGLVGLAVPSRAVAFPEDVLSKIGVVRSESRGTQIPERLRLDLLTAEERSDLWEAIRRSWSASVELRMDIREGSVLRLGMAVLDEIGIQVETAVTKERLMPLVELRASLEGDFGAFWGTGEGLPDRLRTGHGWFPTVIDLLIIGDEVAHRSLGVDEGEQQEP